MKWPWGREWPCIAEMWLCTGPAEIVSQQTRRETNMHLDCLHGSAREHKLAMRPGMAMHTRDVALHGAGTERRTTNTSCDNHTPVLPSWARP